MMYLTVTSIGCDPEIFMQDSEGKIRSAIGKFGGTKEKPKPIKSLPEGFAVQEDNILMEFNIPPAGTPKEFVDSVHKVMGVLSKRAMTMGLSFAKGSAYSVDKAELDHPKAKVFGCDPDYNAYTGMKNPPPCASDPCLRSAGGHIAFGFAPFADKIFIGAIERDHGKVAVDFLRQNIVKWLDVLLGLPSVLMDEGDLRKQLYGKAGAFRPKDYGLEYRTLSNFWLFDKRTQMILENASRVLKSCNCGYMHYSKDHHGMGNMAAMTEFAINTNDKDFAAWAVRKYNATWFPGIAGGVDALRSK